ncbi:MAG: hypothetical protein AAF633_24375, partial [Chloroflexota bacterium]
MSTEKTLTYGSIIHLKNGAPNGGYLGASRPVVEEDVLGWTHHSVLTFVFTHAFENGQGSGSWEILPTTKNKKIGDILRYGDSIELRNLRPNAINLAGFDWANIVDVFKEHAEYMHNPVYTVDPQLADKPAEKDMGMIIESAEGLALGTEVVAGAKILLKQNWLFNHRERFKSRGIKPNETYLTTYKKVKEVDAFNEGMYAGEKLLTFIGPNPPAEGSNKWTVTLSDPANSSTIYHLWGEVDGAWLDFGSIEIKALCAQPLAFLKFKLEGDGKLTGRVSYGSEGFVEFIGAPTSEENVYAVTHKQNRDFLSQYPNAEWAFGARRDKKIVALSLKSDDRGQTFSGSIQYEGEGSIDIKGNIPAVKPFLVENESVYYDFMAPANWGSRMAKVLTTLQSLQAEVEKASYPHIVGMLSTMETFWTQYKAAATQTAKQLEQRNITPPIYIFSEMIRHMTLDIERLQSGIQQRQALKSHTNGRQDSLKITDALSAMALTPIKSWSLSLPGGSETIIPITYFDDRIHIRQMPYTSQFMLIALTYDLALSFEQIHSNKLDIPPFDLMAIPHEIGHYVYHFNHGSGSSTPHVHNQEQSHELGYKHHPPTENSIGWLSQADVIKNNPYSHWSEEIFADLYGCLISGPLTVLGIQSLLATSHLNRLLKDDSLHPTPIFRPYLISEMLRVLNKHDSTSYDFNDTALMLDANWSKILDRWGVQLENVYNGRPERIIVSTGREVQIEKMVEINVATMLKHGRQIIEHFAEALFKHDQYKVEIPKPWSSKQGTLGRYIDDIKILIQSGLKEPVLTPVASNHISEKVKGMITVDSTENKNLVMAGAKAFKV